MSAADKRSIRGLTQICFEVPEPLKKQVHAVLRRQQIGIGPWIRNQLKELVADDMERQAWELRQEAAGVAAE